MCGGGGAGIEGGEGSCGEGLLEEVVVPLLSSSAECRVEGWWGMGEKKTGGRRPLPPPLLSCWSVSPPSRGEDERHVLTPPLHSSTSRRRAEEHTPTSPTLHPLGTPPLDHASNLHTHGPRERPCSSTQIPCVLVSGVRIPLSAAVGGSERERGEREQGDIKKPLDPR